MVKINMKVEKQNKRAGSIKKGEVRNPTGRNGFGDGHIQPYKKRIAHYLENYTREQLLDLVRDQKKFNKLSSWDSVAVLHIVGAITRSDTTWRDRESLVERTDGKVPMKQEVRMIRSIQDLTDEELQAIVANSENK